jgi:hypothetical protein
VRLDDGLYKQRRRATVTGYPPPMRLLPLLLLTTLATATARADGPAWQRYSKAGQFSVELPGPAKESAETLGALTMHSVGAEFHSSDERKGSCGVSRFDFTGRLKGDVTPAKLLELGLGPHKKGGRIVEEKVVALGKHPGRALVVENERHRKWFRAYFVGKVQYTLSCGAPVDRSAVDDAIARRFLDSFKLLPRP